MLSELKRFMLVSGGGKRLRFRVCVEGPRGVVEFHFGLMEDRQWDYHGTFPLHCMGVERHERVAESEATEWSKDCDLLKGPCRHDGTSLYASEHVMPAFLAGGTEAVYPLLEDCYSSWFGDAEEASDAA